jgi:hypothetical protein
MKVFILTVMDCKICVVYGAFSSLEKAQVFAIMNALSNNVVIIETLLDKDVV